ncbi:protein CAP22 [Fusarium bulbicola]|nr:protein CAP22 [Fusarium bulbicola]
MRSAIFLAALVAFIPNAFAEELGADDVPTGCKTICQPIVNLTNACDIDPKDTEKHSDRRRDLVILDHEDDDEPIEAACICTNRSFDVEGVMGLCASCMAQNSKDTEDIDKIMSQCSFSSTSYVRAATSVVSGIEVQATKPAATITPIATNTAAAAKATEPVGNSAGKVTGSIMARWALNTTMAILSFMPPSVLQRPAVGSDAFLLSTYAVLSADTRTAWKTSN